MLSIFHTMFWCQAKSVYVQFPKERRTWFLVVYGDKHVCQLANSNSCIRYDFSHPYSLLTLALRNGVFIRSVLYSFYAAQPSTSKVAIETTTCVETQLSKSNHLWFSFFSEMNILPQQEVNWTNTKDRNRRRNVAIITLTS